MNHPYTTNERNRDNEQEKIADDFFIWIRAQDEYIDDPPPSFFSTNPTRAAGLYFIRRYLALLFSGKHAWNLRYCTYSDAFDACAQALDI